MILVLLGPPGSGKGTQAKKLSVEKKWPQLSTGDMLRAAIAKGTELGLAAKALMDKGSLVPDEVVIGLIAERSVESDCKAGFILDGFPRNISQAKALDVMLENQKRSVNRAVLFDISDDELVRRLSGRRTCTKCGAMFHLESLPPKKTGICDQCGNALVQRDDDHKEVIVKRLDVYHKQTEPLVGYYQDQKKLVKVDASRAAAEVLEAVRKAF